MANPQMTYQIGTFNSISVGKTAGNGPLPQFTAVTVETFDANGNNKVSRNGTTTGLVVTGGDSVDIDFAVVPPATNPGGYTYTLMSAFFKLTAGTLPLGGIAGEFPKQKLSVDKSNVNWLTVTNKNQANSTNSPTFEFYLVVYRSDGEWGLIDPLISNQP